MHAGLKADRDQVNTGGDEIVRRLDALLGLLVLYEPSGSQKRSVEEQSVVLSRSGLRPVEIARIVGRVENNVRRDIAKARQDGRLSPNSKSGKRRPGRMNGGSRKRAR